MQTQQQVDCTAMADTAKVVDLINNARQMVTEVRNVVERDFSAL